MMGDSYAKITLRINVSCLLVVLAFSSISCATTADKPYPIFTITDEMVKPLIDPEIPRIKSAMEGGSPIAVWYCDDERFEKEEGEKEHITTISYWIQGYLEQELVKTREHDVVTRTQLDKVFREQAFQYSGNVDENSMVQMAKILGAKYLVVPRITRINSLNIQILDSESAKIIYLSDMAIEKKSKAVKP